MGWGWKKGALPPFNIKSLRAIMMGRCRGLERLS